MDINEDKDVLDQGAATNQKGEYLPFFFMTEVNLFMIIWVRNGEKVGQCCVSPRVGFGPKSGNPLQKIMS